ncbi:MAG: tRNA uridine-5-carboxymethylaminomethyl(34) synthesis GTPase MnmE [Anaerolineales bacterium]
MYSLDDTIAAISTPIGRGGIGIVRLSGDEALPIATQIFVPQHPWQGEPASHYLHYGHIVDPETGDVVDEVLLSYMKAPRTYTRQDIVEINAHGGIVPLQQILSLCLNAGARMAREGEFTLRAFLNGRIDLTQAEAVADIVRSRTEAALRVAVNQLNGSLANEVQEIRESLLHTLAYLEAIIDFPEEDIPEQDVEGPLEEAAQRLEALLEEAKRGIIYRQGIHAAIVGRPNVGKSSLLNTLLRTDRAIVTPIPGTTRDTLEETVDLEGIPFVLVDTAGIDETDNVIEQQGIERSRAAVQQADMVLLVVDGSERIREADRQVAALCETKPSIVVVNKEDLPTVCHYRDTLPHAPHITVSALRGTGISELEELIVDTVLSGRVVTGETPVASNPRHRALFRRALQSVRHGQEALQQGLPADFLTIDISEAVDALGRVTGETASEELLESIFSDFCIGK